MEKSRPKLKAPTMIVAPPKDRDEADHLIYQIGQAQRERDSLQTAMNAELAKTKLFYESKAELVNRKIKAWMEALQAFCEQNRNALCPRGSKTAKFGNGEVSWRFRPPKVMLRNAAKIIEWIKVHSQLRFIRTIEEIDKEAMLRDPAWASNIPGVKIASEGEDFIVKPFESKLEEVA